MDKTDFIQVNPPLGPVIVLRGNIQTINPAFDENGKLVEIAFVTTASAVMRWLESDAENIVSTLNARFDLSIGKSAAVRDLDKVREVKSLLDDTQ